MRRAALEIKLEAEYVGSNSVLFLFRSKNQVFHPKSLEITDLLYFPFTVVSFRIGSFSILFQGKILPKNLPLLLSVVWFNKGASYDDCRIDTYLPPFHQA